MSPSKRLPLVAALLGGALLLARPDPAGADPPPMPRARALAEGITVEGVGEVRVHATHLEVRAHVTATAEVARDAYEEYAELKLRAVQGLAASGIEGLEVRGLGATLSYFEGQDPEMMMAGIVFDPGGQVQDEPSVRYREEFLLTVAGADALDDAGKAATVAALLDAAVDNGMGLASTAASAQMALFLGQMPAFDAPPALVTFRLRDPAEVERAAYGQAIQHARRRAAALAELAGVALGPVRSIEVLSTTEEWQTATSENTCQARLRVVFGLN